MKTRIIIVVSIGGLCLCCLFYSVVAFWAVRQSIVPAMLAKAKQQWVVELLRNASRSWHQELADAPDKAEPILSGALRHYRSLSDNKSLALNCSTCALVSSSGYLLGRRGGGEIDGKDCVLRLNMAPVAGFELDVGSRTTLRVLNFFLLGVKPASLPAGSRLLAWGLGGRPGHLQNATALLAELSSNGSVIYGQSKEGEREAEEVFAQETGLDPRATRSWISTGWFAMMIALDICQQVHVYGMVPANYCMTRRRGDPIPYHYYEEPWVKECSIYRQAEVSREGGHRFVTEKAVFAGWARRHNITFHHPSWPEGRDTLRRALDTPFVRKHMSKGLFKWMFS